MQRAVNNGTVKVDVATLPKQQLPYNRNILIIGIKDTTGTAGNLELKKNITSLTNIRNYFGRGSHIASGLEYAVDFANKYNFGEFSLQVSGLGIDSVGTASAGAIKLDGTATEDGVIEFICGSQLKRKSISVVSGDTAEDVIVKIKAVLDADLDLLFTSAVDDSDVEKLNLTARQRGKFLEKITLKINNLPAGITLHTLTQFTGGNYTGINLSALKTAIEDEEFDSIVIEKDIFDADASLVAFFEDRVKSQTNFYSMGQVIFCDVNSTEGSITNSLKDKTFGISLALKQTYELPFKLATEIACMKEGRLVEGFSQNAVNLMTSRGGVAYANLPFTGIRSALINTVDFSIFNKTEQASLNTKGFLTLEMNNNGLAIYTGNQAMSIEDVDGNESNFKNITDFEKMGLTVRQIFVVGNSYLNKSLKGNIVDVRFDITRDTIKGDLQGLIRSLGGSLELVDENSGLVKSFQYGILTNDATTIQSMDSVIDENVNKLVLNSKTIVIDILSILTEIINEVGFTVVFSK